MQISGYLPRMQFSLKMNRKFMRCIKVLKSFLYLLPVTCFIWYFIPRDNFSLFRKSKYDIQVMDQKEMYKDPFSRAGPIQPPPDFGNQTIVLSKEDVGEDPQYDGEKVAEIDPYISSEELYNDTGPPPVLDPLSKWIDDQVLPTVNNKPKIDRNVAGVFGKPVIIDKDKLIPEERKLYDQGWRNYAFNEYASLMIPLNRSLPDPRDKECKDIQYKYELPDVSVVVTFHNEAWTVLLRSVHSIINRSPQDLLKEIILVDDFSNMEITNMRKLKLNKMYLTNCQSYKEHSNKQYKYIKIMTAKIPTLDRDRTQLKPMTFGVVALFFGDHLKKPLEDYMEKLGIVKIVRTKQREGLIRARLLGNAVATGSVLVFLDSHVECAEGWLPPLLHEIAMSNSTVVTPVIDTISDETFAFSFQSAKGTNVGGFDWSLTFTWHAIPDAERARRNYKDYVPVRSPTMAGGLFAVNRDYFNYIGSYDEGMEIWGGENLELSFRIWMCGGTLLTVPCSHVGHIFRKHSPYSWGNKPVLFNNNVRMAEVWLDEFKDYYYQIAGYNLGDYGDISARKELRKQLNCKDFNWFLTHVYPEINVPAEALYSGEIRSKVAPLCLYGPFMYGDIKSNNVEVRPCFGNNSTTSKTYWLYTKTGEIRHRYGCFDYSEQIHKFSISSCHGLNGNQHWLYREDNTIYHDVSKTCIELSSDRKSVSLQKCLGTDSQIWHWNRQPPKGPARRW